MAVPWTGVPLAKLVNFARPQAGAKYIKFETFEDKNIAPGQRQVWYPWPYVEGLTIEEATNPLALLTTGIYGKSPCRIRTGRRSGWYCRGNMASNRSNPSAASPLPTSNPKASGKNLQIREYGFWANVNLSLITRAGHRNRKAARSGERVLTLKYNGYGEWVEGLYADMPQERTLFFQVAAGFLPPVSSRAIRPISSSILPWST